MATSSDTLASIGIGAFAGIAEVTANQPFIYFKNCLQTGKPIIWNPLVLYRGYFVNISTLGPITAFQVAASDVIYKTFFQQRDRAAFYASTPPPSSTSSTTPVIPPKSLFGMGTSSLIAGSLSGLLSGPSESIILQQQQTGKSALPTLQSMVKEYGVRSVFRGTPYAMMRDGGFTAGFMALGPFFSSTLLNHGYNEFISRLGGGIIAGIIAAIITHPFDTIKTKYQNDFRMKLYPSLRHVVKDGSVFNGLSARGVRVIIGTVIISNVTDILTKQYQVYKVKQGNL